LAPLVISYGGKKLEFTEVNRDGYYEYGYA